MDSILMPNKIFYRWATAILFATEVFIAIAIPSDSFIRHSFGDFLVVILLYCLVKSFTHVDSKQLAIGVWLFSFAIEFAQYFHLVDVLGIQNKIARIVIGTSFSVSDLVMYSLGCIAIYWLDSWWLNRRTP
jgi:hypothetical protein